MVGAGRFERPTPTPRQGALPGCATPRHSTCLILNLFLIPRNVACRALLNSNRRTFGRRPAHPICAPVPYIDTRSSAGRQADRFRAFDRPLLSGKRAKPGTSCHCHSERRRDRIARPRFPPESEFDGTVPSTARLESGRGLPPHPDSLPPDTPISRRAGKQDGWNQGQAAIQESANEFGTRHATSMRRSRLWSKDLDQAVTLAVTAERPTGLPPAPPAQLG